MAELLELVDDVFFYNKWADLDRPDLRSCFELFTAEEVRALNPDDTIWLNEELYHPNGKVFGFTRCTVERIELVGGQVRVHHATGFSSLPHRMAKVADKPRLESMQGEALAAKAWHLIHAFGREPENQQQILSLTRGA